MQPTSFRRVSPALLFVASAVLSSTWGCAHLPHTGAEATGEALDVEVNTQTYTYTTQTKVGEVVNRDSYGNVVGTAEIYENRTGFYDVRRWQAFQGEMPIDDQDFFRIAGDVEAANHIAAYRRSGVTMNRIGVGLLIGGGALALAGLLLLPTLTTKDAYGIARTPSWPTYVMGAGGITLSVGGIMTFLGLAKARREHPIDDPARAHGLAKRYNKSLGIQSSRVVPKGPRAIPPMKEEPKPTRNREDSLLDNDLD